MTRVKVFLLMAALTALLVLLGGWIGGQSGALMFFGIAAVTNFAMYWWSDKMVLRMYGARTVSEAEAPELYRMVDRLRRRAGLPMPVLAISPNKQPNAFATGRDPQHAVVCFTQGILELIPPDELEGVTAHELGHVQHHHMLLGTIAATMAGAISMIGMVVRWGAIFGGFGGRDERSGSLLELLAIAIVAPFAAMILHLAISRQNEYQADRAGAEICGKPLELAGALRRMDDYAHRIPMRVNPAAAQLAIVNPLAGSRGMGLYRFLSTHPPTAERIARLEEMAHRTPSRG